MCIYMFEWEIWCGCEVDEIHFYLGYFLTSAGNGKFIDLYDNLHLPDAAALNWKPISSYEYEKHSSKLLATIIL